jgi:hypothetical protein
VLGRAGGPERRDPEHEIRMRPPPASHPPPRGTAQFGMHARWGPGAVPSLSARAGAARAPCAELGLGLGGGAAWSLLWLVRSEGGQKD